MKRKNVQPITDAELQVMKVLWAQPLLAAREITEAIYGDPSTSNIGTVQKLLQRLEQKQFVKRDRSRYVHRFEAIQSQQSIAGNELQALADKVTDGQLAPFISHLVKNEKLSAEDREAIRKMLDEHGRQS